MSKAICSCKEYKKAWKKEKMLITNVFSFSHNAFRSLHFLGRENKGLFVEGLTLSLDFSCLINLFPNDKFFYSSKLRKFADVKNERKFFKRVENTVRKGKIDCYEQFLPFSECFLKTYTTVWKLCKYCKFLRSIQDGGYVLLTKYMSVSIIFGRNLFHNVSSATSKVPIYTDLIEKSSYSSL